jgi:isoquinoline 1-oxidoreductase beta subunit
VIEQAPADSVYGNQVTGGSASISGSYLELRMAGAKVRQMLVNAAAEAWGVDSRDCSTIASLVVHPDGVQALTFGALAGNASEQGIPNLGEFSMKPDADFGIIGTDIHHWDAPDIITGKARYGMDVRLPGMLYAAIARSPVFGGTIAAYDDNAALQVPGVKSVQVIGDWIAVVAEHTWGALKGRDALEIEWVGGNSDLNSESILTDLRGRSPEIGSAGNGGLDAVYEFPYQAHVTMEPMNCTADVKGDTCEIWVPTQSPQDVQGAVQRALGFSRGAVTVHVTLMGGGFGRRLQSDYGVEAALLSQAIQAPVQVVWTRADDVRHDFYHPMTVMYASGDPASGRRPKVRTYDGGSTIPTGAWRSVGNHPDAYATECFIDEMAAARGVDPFELRREIYSGRSLSVIELAAEKAGWGDPLPESWGRGMAFHATFGVTHVAMVAEVEVRGSSIKVHRVVCAVDAGIAINPDNIAAQMEGGVAFGLTAALKGGVTLENGAIKESNFHDCPILQINEMPQVEVHIIEGASYPTGIGEMGVPPVAPAIANAVYGATGVRVRHLPILGSDL